VIIAIYVDDCLIIGDDLKINEVIKELKGYNFGLKVEDHVSDYLSCRIITNLENKTLFIMQPHLIKNLEVKFGAEVVNLSNYGMAGTPRFKIVRPSENVDKIDPDLQTMYRSGVGMLLFIIK
jgi:hypothetical protein